MSYQSGVRVRVRLAALVTGLAAVVFAAGPELDRAQKLYNSTNFEESLKILQAVRDKNGAVYELIGRNYYMQGHFKKATDALEKAMAAEPNNSQYALWLGRAYGRRAETSSVITAPGYASKTRQYFEKAVQLNPRNMEAMTDLLEYYLEAPGILGGGFDKAQALAEKIGGVDASEGHWAQAKLAEKKKEYATAEAHLQQAVNTAPRQVGRLIDLARFLNRRGRYAEAEQNFAKAESIAPNNPKLLYERAQAYLEANRNLPLAKDLLKRFLNLSLTPDDPPRSEAVKLLRQVQGG